MYKRDSIKNEIIERPVLRWVGGKSWLVKEIKTILPAKFNNYHEPFLGGGAVFFNLKPRGLTFLSDSNYELINTYIQIRDNVEKVCVLLEDFRNDESYYYSLRSIEYKSAVKRAARFIYLNRTSFNGIYRVNKKGEYNVPYGFKKYKSLFDYDKYRRASDLLKNSNLYCDDFETSLDKIDRNDLIFLDPPYIASHYNNGFINYNERLFSWEDQQRLADYISKIKSKKAIYILTQAKHESIYQLFSKLDAPRSIERSLTIGGKRAKRGMIEEYIFTNL